MIVHWFNPCCLLLFKELSEVAEICCDKQVIAGRNECDRKEYGTLLIDMAAGRGTYAGHEILLSSRLIGSNTEKMKRRIQEMKKKERVNKVFGSFILVMVFQLVFTAAAFAYAPVSKLEVGNSGLNPYDVQDIFIPGDVQKIITEDFTMGNTIFIEDKTGTYKIFRWKLPNRFL